VYSKLESSSDRSRSSVFAIVLLEVFLEDSGRVRVYGFRGSDVGSDNPGVEAVRIS